MKKFALIFAFLTFLGGFAISQTLTWQFANFEVINAGAQLQFDVEVKADIGTTYHRDLQVYFDYNTAGFGSDVATSTTVTPLVLMDNFYFVVNTADNTSSKLAIITEATNEMTPGSTDFNLMPSTFTGLLRITMDIIDNTETAGIAFDEALMNGGQYYQEIATANPVKYTDPCFYDNDLLTNLLSTGFGTITYAISNDPIDGASVDLVSGTPIDNAITDANGDYHFNSPADGGYTLETSHTAVWGGLNVIDVFFTKLYNSGATPPVWDALMSPLAADVTYDGTVNIIDIFMMELKNASLTAPLWNAPDWLL